LIEIDKGLLSWQLNRSLGRLALHLLRLLVLHVVHLTLLMSFLSVLLSTVLLKIITLVLPVTHKAAPMTLIVIAVSLFPRGTYEGTVLVLMFLLTMRWTWLPTYWDSLLMLSYIQHRSSVSFPVSIVLR
jgi:hypothetical protein